MKKLLFFFFLYLAYNSYSQVGIGNSTPRGGLDINRPTTNTYGLVLPANPLTTNMRNPQGGAIAAATTMFDTTNDCIRFFRQNAWSNCLLTENVSLTAISKVEQASTFNGTYKQDVAMVTANTYTIGIKNESPAAVSITLSPLDLKLSGVSGLSVASVSPTSVTIQPGQTSIVTYRIAGTPTTCGELIGTWKKIKIDHTATTNVIVNPTYACDLGSWNDSVLPEYRLTGLVPGESYTGTYTIPYTNAGECPLPPETITVNGLTLTYAGGQLAPSGEITYTLSGTYTSGDGSATFTTSTGCVIYLGPCRSCQEVLNSFPNSPDGIYKIDPDQELSVFGVMNAQCDMTTDGGGWTMVLNYLHLGGTNPAISIRTTTPLLGSSTLGENEATNTTTWGNANRALQLAMAPTEYRFYGITNGHNRVIHFKTAHAGSVTYFTRGTGNANGIQTSFTPLDGHTANLPANSNAFYTRNQEELLYFPFVGTPTLSHWGIAASGRWEVDDYPNNASRSTLHRVWAR